MSQEIIAVLEYIGEKLGIAIDWTAENVCRKLWQFSEDIEFLKLLRVVSG